jgi:hypothetical protein
MGELESMKATDLKQRFFDFFVCELLGHCITDEQEDQLPLITTCKRCGILIHCTIDENDEDSYYIEEVGEYESTFT